MWLPRILASKVVPRGLFQGSCSGQGFRLQGSPCPNRYQPEPFQALYGHIECMGRRHENQCSPFHPGPMRGGFMWEGAGVDLPESREQRAEAGNRPACWFSPFREGELTAQSRNAHASAPRRAKRRTLGRSPSCPKDSSTPHPACPCPPAAPHAYRKQHTPPTTITPPAASCPRGSHADIQHYSSRWHRKHLLECAPPSLSTITARGD